MRALGKGHQIEPAEPDGAVRDPRAPARQEPDQRPAGQGLARAALADQPQHLALAKLEGDLVDRAQRAAGCGELDGQILDPKDRPAHSRTPSFSPSPSARKLKPSARNTIASPGKVVIHQAVVMKFWPSAIITPHSAVGGWTPRPR